MAAPFVDTAKITVKAGNGGNGCVSFHREKYVAAGGPDGGDGGNGGNIILQVDDNLSTLMDFRYKRKYVAENGVDGMGQRKSGKDGKSLTIRVPRGTLVRDAESPISSAGAARAAGATPTSPPPLDRPPGSPRAACPGRASTWCWS